MEELFNMRKPSVRNVKRLDKNSSFRFAPVTVVRNVAVRSPHQQNLDGHELKMHAVVVARTSLRRRLALPSALHAASTPLQRPGAAAGSLVLRVEPSLGPSAAWQLQRHAAMSTAGPSPPKIVAAKALAARLRRKTKKKTAAKVPKVKPEKPLNKAEKQQRQEEDALLQAAARPAATNAATTDAAAVQTAEAAEETAVAAVVQEATVIADVPPTPETSPVVEKPKKKKQQQPQQQQAQAVAPAPVVQEANASEEAESPADAAAVVPAPAPAHPPLPAPPKRQPKPLKDLETDKITMTLKEIESLQKQLPSVEEVASLVGKLRRESFVKGQTLFDLYRIYGNPFLDENFLTPGVLACCEAKKPAQGIQIVRDMLEQGRKVEESTLRALLDVCDETSAAREVVELWDLMDEAGVKLELKDYNKLLDICHRRDYLDGAIKVLKVLRLHRSISVHSYMHWLNQAMLVWRSDLFFDLLMEMRLSGVEPEILSLTSLESGRKDRALTVMEGVRAVGLDPCFAMSAVFSSMQYSVYKNGPAAEAITESDVSAAKKKFGDLRAVEIDWPTKPIPQVLETQAAGLILQQETFRRLKLSQVQRIDELLQMLPITTNMTINLRKQLQRMSLLVNTHRVKRDAPKIAAEYDSGKSLIELSLTHNYPPVSLMRIILKERGLSASGIKRALNAPTTHLSKRDQNELRKATGYDSIHRSDPFIGAAMYNADSLETTIAHFLRARGIRFKTEDELGDEQHDKYGRRVLSPDILLLDPVVVNGTPIRWIDAKNYYGAHIVSKRLISKQLASYVKEWGPGAIVFGMGFSDMFSVPGVVCLDTTPFPKTRSEAVKMRTQSMLQSVVQAFSWKKHLGSDLTQEYPSQPEGRGSRARGAKTREDDDEDEDEDVEAAVREAKPRGGSKAAR